MGLFKDIQTDRRTDRQKRANLDGRKTHILHNIEICLYLSQKRLYFAFKISNKGFTYPDIKTG